MRLARFSDGGSARVGIVQDDALIDVAHHGVAIGLDMVTVIQQWETLRPAFQKLQSQPADLPIAGVRLLAPIERPGKILCIGLNYADHCAEMGMAPPPHQMWFAKMPTSAAGPSDPIEIPVVSSALDYEAEMVVVIGARCRHVPRNRAGEVIFGYCVGNDVSVRDWQMLTSQYLIGKAFDGHAPFGPWITTADAVQPGDLAIRCTVNGETRQHSRTKQLVFDCHAQIELLSKVMTLEPGDILFTGTPGGVGAASKPPRFLREGDTVRVEIESLGAISNRVVSGTGETLIG